MTIPPNRMEGESFDYNSVSATTMWNPTPGNYTRYGDVKSLLAEVDDRMVIMGSGDEIQLRFRAPALPPLPAGWKRDFLLLVDGWAKDADANTAFSQTVLPLPFHAMSSYPYPAGQSYPHDPVHDEYQKEYNTRPALRLIRPLAARKENSVRRVALWALILLAVNGAYLAAFAHATIFYEANVLLHLALGLALAFVAVRYVQQYPIECGIFLGAALVRFLSRVPRQHLTISAGCCGCIFYSPKRRWHSSGWRFMPFPHRRCRSQRCVPASSDCGELWPAARIVSRIPASAPLSMDLEGAGAHSPFAPSSAQTNTGKIIPSNFFMDSAGCGRCHKDIYEQWKSSAHHFASFNNQFYRKSIEYMQDVVGTGPASGARVVMTTPCSLTAASIGPFVSRSILRKRKRDWGACPVTPSFMWAAPWATPISPWSILRCMSWHPARTASFKRWTAF
jgi:hypothetical protein